VRVVHELVRVVLKLAQLMAQLFQFLRKVAVTLLEAGQEGPARCTSIWSRRYTI
jgi:hypothetical protein